MNRSNRGSFPTYRFTAGLTDKAAQDCLAGALR